MIVADFMTRDPLVLDASSALDEALTCMDENHVRHLPIMENGSLVGVLSNRDLLSHTGRSGSKEDGPRWVEQIMQRDIVTVAPDDPVVSAAVEVSVHQIGCLPVLEGGKLIGIVSEVDLLRLVSRAGTESEPISTIGAPTAITVAPTATIAQAESLMIAKSVRHLPVLEGSDLAGMFTDRDLRRALGNGLGPEAQVAGCMTRDVVSVAESAQIHEAAGALADHRISALVLTREDGEFGIVTSTDFLEHALGVLGS